MSNVYVISDLHLGHKNILKFAAQWRHGTTIQEHDDWVVESWNTVVTKRDVVYCLGDVAFSTDALERVAALRGQKMLIMGNHDKYPIETYLRLFARIRPSPFSYKGFWLSHCPIHPAELRGRRNIHGHVHHNTIPDDRYVNVSVEAVGGYPRLLSSIKK